MKSQEQIIKEINLFSNRQKELIIKIKKDAKMLPDFYSIGRMQNYINELAELNFKIEILKSVLI
jgi:AAA+ ATPase superfamily predicted ATPase